MARVQFSEVPIEKMYDFYKIFYKSAGGLVFFEDGCVGLKHGLSYPPGRRNTEYGFTFGYYTDSRLTRIPGVKLYRPDGSRIAKGQLRNPYTTYYVDYDCGRVVALGYQHVCAALPYHLQNVSGFYLPAQDIPYGGRDINVYSSLDSNPQAVEWFKEVKPLTMARARMLEAAGDSEFVANVQRYKTCSDAVVNLNPAVFSIAPDQYAMNLTYDTLAAFYVHSNNINVRVIERFPYLLIK